MLVSSGLTGCRRRPPPLCGPRLAPGDRRVLAGLKEVLSGMRRPDDESDTVQAYVIDTIRTGSGEFETVDVFLFFFTWKS